ncbi:MAG TPA: diaminopimelate decarboxylase [Gemmatimonadales bacterium]|nr:diaminopimelate decarboxylase [Gemmatimonadales bacterium]
MGKGVLTPERDRAMIGEEERRALFEDAGLERREETLYFGGVALSDIADGAGTPLYVYNADAIRQQYARLDTALAGLPHRICYAVKANSNLAVLRVLRDLGAGADIVSGGELHRALAAGYAPADVVFSGVGKSPAELEEAVRAGVGHIHLESADELHVLGMVADRLDRSVGVGIRVNPDVSADTHPYISTGQGGIKFGVPFDQVFELALATSRQGRLRLESIAMHIGSQILDPAPYRQGLGRLAGLVADLRAAGITSLRNLDIGGGLGIRYRDEMPLAPERLAEAIAPLARETGLTVVLEPGRFLVGSAGVMLTTVLSRKHSGGKELVLVDAGMNDLVRPSHYMAYHDIVELESHGREGGRVDVVGPVCETGDFLALDRPLPGVAAGERLAVLGAGAYGFVMSSTYNSRPRSAEVLVDRGRWAIVRPRETVESLYAGETAEPVWSR